MSSLAGRWSFVALVTSIACVGPLVGFIWWATSPGVQGVYFAEGIFPSETEPAGYIDADALFAIGTAIVGCLVALLVRRRLTLTSTGLVLAALTLGGIAGSAIAVLTAYAFTSPERPKIAYGSIAEVPLTLGAAGWLLVWPIACVGTWFVADLWSSES